MRTLRIWLGAAALTGLLWWLTAGEDRDTLLWRHYTGPVAVLNTAATLLIVATAYVAAGVGEGMRVRAFRMVLVGGSNSAGQAAVFLSSHAEHVHLFIRGPSLEQTMSRYLVERVRSLPNLTLHTRIELQGLEGDVQLRRVHYRGAGGTEGSMTTHHLFIFIGAEPNTGWLKSCGVALDSKGFVLTGTGADAVQALPLQTSIEGVFAIGDVRSASTKRVAAAVGEGAAVVAQIHSLLAEERSMGHLGPA